MAITVQRSWQERRRRWGLFGAIVAGLLVFQGYAWFVKRSGETAYLPPDRELVAPAYAGGESTVVQTFVMRADGLEAVRLFAHPKTPPPVGSARLALADMGSGLTIARTTVPAAALTEAAPFEWAIPRVDRSAGRAFVVTIAVPDAPPDRGVLFEVGTPHYADGTLRVNGRDQWGDLKFSTRAARARTIDTLRDLRRRAPAWLPSELVLIAIWLVVNVAIARVLYDLVFSAPASGR